MLPGTIVRKGILMHRRHLVLAMAAMPLVGRTRSALAQGTPAPAGPTIYVRRDAALGTYFSDPAGRSLYLFAKDQTAGQSACTGDCAAAWPPFAAGDNLALPGGVPGTLGSITRDDGTSQVTYNDLPLYSYGEDDDPGDAYGQGVGGVWFVAAPDDRLGDAPAARATPGPAAATPAAAGDIEVTLREFAIEASATTFAAGQPYRFTIRNAGQYRHEFIIEAAGANDEPFEANGKAAEAEAIDPGAEATLEWTFAEPVHAQFACHVMDHYPRGMALNVRVVS